MTLPVLSCFVTCLRSSASSADKSVLRLAPDLNPVAACIAEVPEARAYVDQAAGRARQGPGTNRGLEGRPSRQRLGWSEAAGLEEGLWLCPIEDRRQLDSPREGMLEGFSLGSYVLLVDYTGRLSARVKP